MKTSDQNNDENFVMRHTEDDRQAREAEEVESYELENSSFRTTSYGPYVVLAVGFIVLIILVVFILSKIRNLPDGQQLLNLEARIEQLENKLSGPETNDNPPDAFADQQKQIEALNQRMERLEISISTNMNQMMERLNSLKPASASPKPVEPETAQPAEKKESVSTRTHKVKAGETLYRISKLYGITIEQLRSYNNLKAGDKIYPGQDLKLGPPKTN
jgi:LysM repeat protein